MASLRLDGSKQGFPFSECSNGEQTLGRVSPELSNFCQSAARNSQAAASGETSMLKKVRSAARRVGVVGWCVMAFAMVAIPAAAFAQDITTFYGCGTCGAPAGTRAATTGYATRNSTRVYRTAGNSYNLGYIYSNNTTTGYSSSSGNPYVIGGSGPSLYLAKSTCWNDAGYTQYPVTCQSLYN